MTDSIYVKHDEDPILVELQRIRKLLEKLLEQGNPDGGVYVVEIFEDGTTTGSPFPKYMYKTS